MSDASTKHRLALFFSHGTTVSDWIKQGISDREIGYYYLLSELLGPVSFVTYDRRSRRIKELSACLRPIQFLYNRWNLNYRLFSVLAPFLYYRLLKRCSLFKTNQMSGAWTAAIAKRILHKPLVVRGGFVWSRNVKRRGARGLRYRLSFLLERFALRSADLIFVATEDDRQYVVASHKTNPNLIAIVPNAIDVEHFKPDCASPKEAGLVAYVGRLEAEKRVEALIEAIRLIPSSKLVIIGEGSLESELRKCAAGANVQFLGAVDNGQIPKILNRAEIFVLPSQYEGSPKALLEAMACGLPVVGANVPGIQDIIRHRENGLLTDGDSQGIADSLQILMTDESLRSRLGKNAREYVCGRHMKEAIAQLENKLLRALLEGNDASLGEIEGGACKSA